MLWPYLVVFVLLAGLLLVSVRNRKRAVVEEAVRAERIGVGTEVMTTSGLYGTVVAKNGDGTVSLSIAPGVEVKWAVAALRDAAALAPNYRRGIEPDEQHPAPEGADLRKPDDGA